MGWVPGSEMEKIYNRRHIITEANKISRHVQKKIIKEMR
ncbi:Hypothetical protein W5S_1818 [Pectobacterium parmentieri]|uniref:Uncharacterized protein n=4 Tax=Pectobacterium parmentieri TaxID=1905730 RepID=A0A0H3I3I4_PECPM|nr:Hypothetical protein W5S_1818 [Pectobacterium parmentieri]